MSIAEIRDLSTTSYAILGWLAVRPWTTYELAKQIRRNLRFFWPRAESRLYEEPQNLVAHGLATAERSLTGRRPRTTYAITPAGREALARWLAGPSKPTALWCEALVRVFFADAAGPAELLAAIRSVRELADDIQAAGRAVAREYLEGRAPFPERAPLSGLVFDFLWSFAEHLRGWSERSDAEVRRWEGATAADKRERAYRVFRAGLEAGDHQLAHEDGRRDG